MFSPAISLRDCSISEERDMPRNRAYRLATGSRSASTVMVSFCFMVPFLKPPVYSYTSRCKAPPTVMQVDPRARGVWHGKVSGYGSPKGRPGRVWHGPTPLEADGEKVYFQFPKYIYICARKGF